MTDSPILVRTLADRHAEWDAYVMATPAATFFHRVGWKRVIERAFGHACHYLYAERGGRIVGILPAVHINSRLFSNALISTPFCVYGGAVADDDAVADALYQAACRRADELGVSYFETRESAPRHEDWPRKDLYYTFRRELAETDEANLAAIPRKQRAVVRKSIANGLDWAIDHDIDRLYPLFAYNMRELGTPVFPARYLAALMDEFRQDCDVLTVTHDGQPVAAVLNFYFRDEVLPYYSGAGPQARALKANDYLYYALMCHAVARGARVFDFGRSKYDTGPYHFKRHWGFEPRPLPYEYYLSGIDTMPDVSPNNPKYARFIRMWQRLPLPVTRIVGPWLSRDLG
ncbi:FemAB family XrtA/PEP-CTERM system-associated protein [Salinisphaera sp. Q1T1-3]|uniref:FemAB family XrtA/PEP-CTERM system-associated protein n=1 Tax=Salinisphaera sp. Q1T1-3 TaxID=2321229 RepID=UPI000E708899|nr:FemAB family XrtA/PEP-CTERM system-associated protein [Salinisphaera sp. Q1T1-3]RJS94720.1 FemAB family PEP-CTERM system-associated protein [Salinisphaera sp. Q1T1-3]